MARGAPDDDAAGDGPRERMNAAAAGRAPQPLAGVRVVEFTHMVMGPTCGMVLADMGAEVVKVEPIDGDRTRRLLGAGSGFFPMFNRNKKSVAIDLHSAQGAEVARRLAASADIVAENFKPGTMGKYGLDYASLSKANPRVICVSHKGFLPGPYEDRTALDEVVQMMGGLAYMTGRPGDPLRVGSSVNDIMGGLFGAIGALGALIQRGITGRGMEVQSALFENNVFLVGQHMLQYAMTGKPPAPMPARESPWAIYDVFTVRDGEQIFLAAVSDAQWVTFCDALGYADLGADASLAANNDRVRARPTLLPLLRERLASRSGRRSWRRSSSARAFRSRRSASPRTSSTIRTSRRPGASPTSGCRMAMPPAGPSRRRCSRSRWTAAGSACDRTRRAGRAHAGGARVAGILRRRDRPAVRTTRRGVKPRPRTTTPWRRRR